MQKPSFLVLVESNASFQIIQSLNGDPTQCLSSNSLDYTDKCGSVYR
jgi:hypothetical protein